MVGASGHAGKINVKLLLILIGIVAVVGVGLVVAQQMRRQFISTHALAAGNEAFDKQDWAAAATQFERYLNYNPEDTAILRKWSQASLAVEPMEVANLDAAIKAHRQLIHLGTNDSASHEMLAKLYAARGDAVALNHIATQWAQREPGNGEAIYWQAWAHVAQSKPADAAAQLESLITRLEASPPLRSRLHSRACVMLSVIARANGEEALSNQWLDRALAHDPRASSPLANRARFQRMELSAAASPEERQRLFESVRRDLELAEEGMTEDPLAGLRIVEEWTAWDNLDRAQKCLDLLDGLDRSALRTVCVDMRQWTLDRFKTAADLAMQQVRGHVISTASATAPSNFDKLAALAGQALSQIHDRRMRLSALSVAAKLYLTAGRLDDARNVLKEYRELALVLQETADVQDNIALLEAALALAEERPWQSLSLVEPIAARRPDNVLAWQLMVEACRHTEQPKREHAALLGLVHARAQGQGSQPLDAQSFLGLIRGQLAQGELASVVELARQAQQSIPEAAADFQLVALQAGFQLAVQGRSGGQSDRMAAIERELAELRASQPARSEVRVLQADVSRALGRIEAAEQELRRAIDECQQPLDAEIALASLCNSLNRREEAIQIALSACQRHPGQARPWATLAQLYQEDDQAGKAVEALEKGTKTVESARDREDLQIRHAVLFLLGNRREDGIAMLQDLRKQYAQSIRIRTLLLSSPEITEDQPAAQAIVDEIRNIQGEAGMQWRLHQASLWLADPSWRNRQSEINQMLTRCLEVDPQWQAPALLLSAMYERLGDLSRAEEVCRRVLAADPAAVSVADRLVGLLMRSNQQLEAMRVLDQLAAGAEAANSRRLVLAMNAGDLEGAESQLRERIDQQMDAAGSRVLLAHVSYARDHNARKALDLLDEAQQLSGLTPMVMTARVAIVEADRGGEEARKLLDDYVAQSDTYEARLLRAAFFQRQKMLDLAEQDYLCLPNRSNQPAAYLALSGFYDACNRLDPAIETLRKGIDAHAADNQLRLELVSALLRRGAEADRSEADALLKQMENQASQSAAVMRTRATYLLTGPGSPDLDRAEALLQRTVDLEPSAVLDHANLITISIRRGDLKQARSRCQVALGANPEDGRLLLMQGKVELALGNRPLAATLFRRAVAKGAAELDAISLMTEQTLAVGKSEEVQEARALVAGRLAQDSDNEALQVANARLLGKLGRSDEAMQGLEAYCLTQTGQASTTALLTLAELHRQANHLEQADRWTRQAEALAPESLPVLLQRLILLGATSNYDQALALADKIAARADASASALLLVAGVLRSSSNAAHQTKARSLLEQALATAPGHLPAQVALANLAFHLGDMKLSEKMYRSVLAADAENVHALNDLAWILSEVQRRPEEALALADRAVAIDPEDRTVRDTRGVILARLNRQLDALRDFEKCRDLAAPGSREQARALLWLARTCMALNDPAQARPYVEQASKLKATNGLFSPEEAAELDRLRERCSAAPS